MRTQSIPLSLYIHIPWCVRKCPYCDFNSHQSASIPEQEYTQALIKDLADTLPKEQRPLTSIFFGGGTPSLFGSESLAKILTATKAHANFADGIEITLETNPGTAEYAHFDQLLEAGINRLSFGAQSFNDKHLEKLGRIHQSDEIFQAVDKAKLAGFENINLDLMHGLPDQTRQEALSDLATGIALAPTHLSWYQLTIEPNTAFYNTPPTLPDDEILSDIQDAGEQLLAQHGYAQYEVSAYSKQGWQSKHNLNYWTFGDYIGAGAGAHSKLTTSDGIFRYQKSRLPEHYMSSPTKKIQHKAVTLEAQPLEFMMNALRLKQGCELKLLMDRTEIDWNRLESTYALLVDRGLCAPLPRLATTPQGYRFLNTVLSHFDA